jgi:hypothetical protein
VGPGQYCVEGCVPGNPGATFLPGKCHGRQEVACTSVGGGQFGCLPTCNADVDCGAGYRCNPQTGLCQNAASVGLADGSACADDSECSGECVAQGSLQVCSRRCTLGAVPQCGWYGLGTPATAFCLLADADNASPGIGDAGHCVTVCDCDDDCAAPGLHCEPFSGDTLVLKEALQKQGSCSPDASQPGISCP